MSLDKNKSKFQKTVLLSEKIQSLIDWHDEKKELLNLRKFGFIHKAERKNLII